MGSGAASGAGSTGSADTKAVVVGSMSTVPAAGTESKVRVRSRPDTANAIALRLGPTD